MKGVEIKNVPVDGLNYARAGSPKSSALFPSGLLEHLEPDVILGQSICVIRHEGWGRLSSFYRGCLGNMSFSLHVWSSIILENSMAWSEVMEIWDAFPDLLLKIIIEHKFWCSLKWHSVYTKSTYHGGRMQCKVEMHHRNLNSFKVQCTYPWVNLG